MYELSVPQWKKIEDIVHEVLVILEGTRTGRSLEQVGKGTVYVFHLCLWGGTALK
jgi:hypothetical protein